jgi:hypothetical protein
VSCFDAVSFFCSHVWARTEIRHACVRRVDAAQRRTGKHPLGCTRRADTLARAVQGIASPRKRGHLKRHASSRWSETTRLRESSRNSCGSPPPSPDKTPYSGHDTHGQIRSTAKWSGRSPVPSGICLCNSTFFGCDRQSVHLGRASRVRANAGEGGAGREARGGDTETKPRRPNPLEAFSPARRICPHRRDRSRCAHLFRKRLLALRSR